MRKCPPLLGKKPHIEADYWHAKWTREERTESSYNAILAVRVDI